MLFDLPAWVWALPLAWYSLAAWAVRGADLGRCGDYECPTLRLVVWAASPLVALLILLHLFATYVLTSEHDRR